MKLIPNDHLRILRNTVPLPAVIADLRIPTRTRGRRLTFRCPGCGGFHTATNSRSNLARCFRCERNFNAIELAMSVKKLGFLDALQLLEPLLLTS